MLNKSRFLVSTLFLAIFLAGLWGLPQRDWAIFTALLAAWAMWEWGSLADLKTGQRVALGGVVLAVALGLAIAFPDAVQSVVPIDESQLERMAFTQAAWDLGVWFYVPALLFWCLLAPAWVARQWRLRLGEGKKALLSILGLWLILATWLAMVQIRAQGVSGLLFMLVIAGVIALLVFLVRRKFGGVTRTPEDAFRQERRVALRGIFLFGLGWAVWLIWVGRGGVKGDALWILLVFVPAILLLPVASLGVVGIHLKMLLQRQANLPCRTNLLDVMAGLMAILPCFALLLLIGGQIPD